MQQIHHVLQIGFLIHYSTDNYQKIKILKKSKMILKEIFLNASG